MPFNATACLCGGDDCPVKLKAVDGFCQFSFPMTKPIVYGSFSFYSLQGMRTVV